MTGAGRDHRRGGSPGVTSGLLTLPKKSSANFAYTELTR